MDRGYFRGHFTGKYCPGAVPRVSPPRVGRVGTPLSTIEVKPSSVSFIFSGVDALARESSRSYIGGTPAMQTISFQSFMSCGWRRRHVQTSTRYEKHLQPGRTISRQKEPVLSRGGLKYLEQSRGESVVVRVTIVKVNGLGLLALLWCSGVI